MAALLRVHPPSLDGALLGEVVVRTATCPRERVAEDVVEILGVAPGDAVLELGCGSGRMLSVVVGRLREGRALGLDPSELMVRHASQLGANAIIGMRYDANEIAAGVTEVLAYGTAVIVEAIPR